MAAGGRRREESLGITSLLGGAILRGSEEEGHGMEFIKGGVVGHESNEGVR